MLCLRKIVFLFMSFIMFSVNANEGSRQSLKSAYDDLNYSLSVEWDQKDRSFYDSKIKKFNDEINELLKQGMAYQELADFAVSMVKDRKLANELQTAFTLIQLDKLSSEKAGALLTDIMAKQYNKGASWSGEATLVALGVGLILVAIVAVVLSSNNSYSCYSKTTCVDFIDVHGNVYDVVCAESPQRVC